MTTYNLKDYELEIKNQKYLINGWLELDKDLSLGEWNGDIIFTDFGFDSIFLMTDDQAFEVDETAGLTVAFIVDIERQFYGSEYSDLYENCLEYFAERQGVEVLEDEAA